MRVLSLWRCVVYFIPGALLSRVGLQLIVLVRCVFGFVMGLMIAVLDLLGKYPIENVWLNSHCNFISALFGKFFQYCSVYFCFS